MLLVLTLHFIHPLGAGDTCLLSLFLYLCVCLSFSPPTSSSLHLLTTFDQFGSLPVLSGCRNLCQLTPRSSESLTVVTYFVHHRQAALVVPPLPFFFSFFFFSLSALPTLLLYVPFAYLSTGIPRYSASSSLVQKEATCREHVEKCR